MMLGIPQLPDTSAIICVTPVSNLGKSQVMPGETEMNCPHTVSPLMLI